MAASAVQARSDLSEMATPSAAVALDRTPGRVHGHSCVAFRSRESLMVARVSPFAPAKVSWLLVCRLSLPRKSHGCSCVAFRSRESLMVARVSPFAPAKVSWFLV